MFTNAKLGPVAVDAMVASQKTAEDSGVVRLFAIQWGCLWFDPGPRD
jgi:hypothetical protein